jgi:hypothetical protein
MHAATIAMAPGMPAWHDEWREGFALPCLPFWANVLTLHNVNSSPGYQAIEVFSSNLNAFCRLDSARCIGLYIVCVHYDVNTCTYHNVCTVCLLLNCTLLPMAVHDSTYGTVYRYSTLADQTTPPKITTQCPFFAPGLCLTVVDIKFAVKQISQF